MTNNLKIKNSEEIIKEQVGYGLATAEQVIKNLPEADLDKIGGLEGLLRRTQINIVDSLLRYGFTDYAKKISNMDTGHFSDFWQFKLSLSSLV